MVFNFPVIDLYINQLRDLILWYIGALGITVLSPIQGVPDCLISTQNNSRDGSPTFWSGFSGLISRADRDSLVLFGLFDFLVASGQHRCILIWQIRPSATRFGSGDPF